MKEPKIDIIEVNNYLTLVFKTHTSSLVRGKPIMLFTPYWK